MHDNIYILIPVFNEEKKIGEVIQSLENSFKNIIVVNDGSTDSTEEIVNKTNAMQIKHIINLGQGAAISTGFRYIQNLKDAHAVITFDADGQHSVDDAIKFAHEIKKCDENIIFGSRFIENKINIPPLKRFVLSMVTLITNKLTGLNLTDSHNGLKAYKTNILKNFEITVNGFAFESQIIGIVGRNKISHKEMPTNTIYTDYSKKKGQKLRNGLIILEDIFKSFKLK